MSNVYQSGIGRWIPGVWKLAADKYEYHLWPVLRDITRELPGDRYMNDDIVSFAYQYTSEDAIKRLEENTNRSTEEVE